MVRALFLLVMLAVGFIVFIIKMIFSSATDGDTSGITYKGEVKKTMDATARGVNWVNDQWESSKKVAKEDFVVILCNRCDTKNRVEKTKINESQICENCKEKLI